MTAANQFSLLKQRRFAGLFWIQFLGAFNDNLFKNALVVLVVYRSLSMWGLSAPEVVNVAAGVFILPFLLCSGFAGQLADKWEKVRLIRWVKLLEVFIMVCASIGLLLPSVPMMMIVLFLLGVQATLFGPVKYSFLPQHLNERELTGGNGMIEMGTFVAILIGTILGAVLISVAQYGALIVTITQLLCALIGYATSFTLPLSPANDPNIKLDWNLWRQIHSTLAYARKQSEVFIAITGISWFWLFGAFILTQLPEYVKVTLGGSTYVYTLLLATFSIGIGLGSVLCEKLSHRTIELGLVLFGAIGMTVFGILIFVLSPTVSATTLLTVLQFLHTGRAIGLLVCFAGMSIFAGFYTVPLYAYIQANSAKAYQSRIIGANNILNALFMIVSAALALVLLQLHLTVPQMFLVVSLLNACMAIYLCVKMPAFWQRFLGWVRKIV